MKPAHAEPPPKARQRPGKQNINVWIPDELMGAFDRLLGQTRRTITAEVEMALEAWLTKAHLWPPKKQEEE